MNKPKNLLIMDDEHMIRNLLSEILNIAGYRVISCTEGSEVLELYREALVKGEPFDLVILDLTVPNGMGGLETVAELKNLDPQVRAMVCSGHTSDPIVTDYERFGFVAAISKPYRMESLLKTVQAALTK